MIYSLGSGFNLLSNYKKSPSFVKDFFESPSFLKLFFREA